MNNTTATESTRNLFYYDDFVDVTRILSILLNTLSMTLLIIAMYVLSRKEMDTVFNRLLIVNSIFDFGYVISSFILAILYFVGLVNVPGAIYFIKILIPLLVACNVGSTLSNGSMCIERCIGVFRPFTYRENNLSVSKRRKTQLYYIIPILIVIALMTPQSVKIVELDEFGTVVFTKIIENAGLQEVLVSAGIIFLMTACSMTLFFYLKNKMASVSSQISASELNRLKMLICLMLLDWITPIVRIVYEIVIRAINDSLECRTGNQAVCSKTNIYFFQIRNIIPCVIPALNFLVLYKYKTKFRETLNKVMKPTSNVLKTNLDSMEEPQETQNAQLPN